ncbi:MAG: Ty1/Copia family ribonuclease HI, partial [Desulfobulbia bacterium]
AQYPWSETLFKIDPESPELSKDKAEDFHTFVAKNLFAAKRGRPDIQLAVSFLASRVRSPTDQDWFKLKKMMRFLKRTEDDILTLEAGAGNNIKWYLDAAFAVHYDYKSHTGAAMTLGKGAVQSVSTKQKINTRSSTQAELVSDDDIIAKVLWSKRFLVAQGFKINKNVVYRDNLSTMKLEKNGKASSGKRTRHFHIKYFYITDLLNRNELSHEYCPTDEMIGDYLTKPLTGPKFHAFRSKLMNLKSK